MKTLQKTDPYANVHLLACTSKPQMLAWLGAHQDYSSEPVYNSQTKEIADAVYGERLTKHLLAGGRGHFGVFEHASMTVNAVAQPHLVVAQITRHRLASFDVQSMRYTGENLLQVKTHADLEKVVYSRPVGTYTDRKGNSYEITPELRQQRLDHAMACIQRYKLDLTHGCSEEDARNSLPYGIRQHFVMTMNVRAWMHLFDIRLKSDVQLEAHWFVNDCYDLFCQQLPEIGEWYTSNRLNKAKLSP